MSFLQAARPPAPRTEFTFGIGGSVTISRFVGGRTRIAIIGTEGPSIDMYVDSSALATLADRAEARDSARIFEQSSRGGSVWLARIGDAYDIQAIQSAQTIGVHFTALNSPTLLAMLRRLPKVYPDPPLGIDRMPMALPEQRYGVHGVGGRVDSARAFSASHGTRPKSARDREPVVRVHLAPLSVGRRK